MQQPPKKERSRSMPPSKDRATAIIMYRLLAAIFSITAIAGFACGKEGFLSFLVAALLAATCANDVRLSEAIGNMLHAFVKK
ncbi:MAG: hypothetical protein ACM359_03735 [Bacillota bacterium]